jgi:hypothetical protein
MEITAHEFIVLEPVPMDAMPLEVMEAPMAPADMSPMEVAEPQVVEIVVEELPGAPTGTKDPEPDLEIEETKDDNEAKTDKKPKTTQEFKAWAKNKLDNVPKHRGYDVAGLERAISYLEKVLKDVSKLMREDLDGALDADVIEDTCKKIEDGIDRLQDRLSKVEKSKKSKRKKKAEEMSNDILITVGEEPVPGEEAGLVKEAQKILGVHGVYVMAPLFISRLARGLINGMVSAGHSIEDGFQKLSKKFKLSEREQLELVELLDCMGYPTKRDRLLTMDEDFDASSSDNLDFMANYRG